MTRRHTSPSAPSLSSTTNSSVTEVEPGHPAADSPRAASPESDGDPTRATIHVTLPIGPICRTLALIAAGVAVLGCIANVAIHHYIPESSVRWRHLLWRVDLDHEPSLCAWFSTCLLLACSATLACLAIASRKQRPFHTASWTALSLLFLGLSLDEAIMIHEMADNTLRELLNTSGPLYFPWVILGFLFAAGVGIAFARFLWTLPRPTLCGMLLSASLFLGGALGMEVASTMGYLHGGFESWGYIASITAEELLEMLGVILFLRTLLVYHARVVGNQRSEPSQERITANLMEGSVDSAAAARAV